MLFIEDPELQADLPRPVMQRDLINAGLMASLELEMDRAVAGHAQILRGCDNLAAIERFYDDALTGHRRAISDRDIDHLIVSQADTIEVAIVTRGRDWLCRSQIDGRGRIHGRFPRSVLARRRGWCPGADKLSISLEHRRLRRDRSTG